MTFLLLSKGSGIPNLFTNISYLFHSTNLSKLLSNILGKKKYNFRIFKIIIILRTLNS